MVGMHGSQERRAAPWHPAAAAMPVFFFMHTYHDKAAEAA